MRGARYGRAGTYAGGMVPHCEPAPRDPKDAIVFDDPLTQRSSDDSDQGWGERPSDSGSAAELARLLDEKPPHHL